RTGGISLFAAFILALIVSQLFVVNPNDVPDNLPATLTVLRFDPKEVIRLAGLIGGTALIFVIGMLDDRLELPPLVLYIGQLAAGSIAVLFLIFIEYVNNPFSGLQTADFPYLFTIVITLFWIGLLTNTVNFLDGVDGLATGVVALACLVLFLNAAFRLEPAQYSVALMPLALLGATLAFCPTTSPRHEFFSAGEPICLGICWGC
ncbi:MAG: MraY family glycosyltransferase, partial [Anaerolineae bacterium]